MILLRKVESFNLGCNKVSAVRNVTGSWLSNDTIVKMWSGFTLLLSIEERSWILKVEGESIYPQLCQVCYQWSSSMLWKGMFIPPSSSQILHSPPFGTERKILLNSLLSPCRREVGVSPPFMGQYVWWINFGKL